MTRKRYTTVLLDAGGIILDETRYEERTKELIVETLNTVVDGYSESDYSRDLNESIRRFSPHNRQYVIWKYSQGDPAVFSGLWNRFKERWASEDHRLVLMPGIENEIPRMRSKYNTLLAGQYGRDLIRLLEEKSLLRYFMTSFSQDDFGITKPDPRYFQEICGAAHIDCEDCIMVGDRIDKDVIPARQNRMGTVFVRSGIYREQKPRTPDERPDLTLESVSNLASNIENFFGWQ